MLTIRSVLRKKPKLLLAGSLDFRTAPTVAKRVSGMPPAKGLGLDLSQVTYIDLSALATLLAVDRTLRLQSRQLVILGPSACVRQAFRLFGPIPLLVRG